MLAHVNEPPPSPLPERPALPRGLDDVVRRAMAKDPAERFPSAGDLGEAALVAAGGQRRANAESVVATGRAAPPAAMPGLSRAFEPVAAEADAADAVGASRRRAPLGLRARLPGGARGRMVAALNALSTL